VTSTPDNLTWKFNFGTQLPNQTFTYGTWRWSPREERPVPACPPHGTRTDCSSHAHHIPTAYQHWSSSLKLWGLLTSTTTHGKNSHPSGSLAVFTSHLLLVAKNNNELQYLRWIHLKLPLIATVPNYYLVDCLNFLVDNLKEFPRMWHLDAACKSYEQTKFGSKSVSLLWKFCKNHQFCHRENCRIKIMQKHSLEVKLL